MFVKTPRRDLLCFWGPVRAYYTVTSVRLPLSASAWASRVKHRLLAGSSQEQFTFFAWSVSLVDVTILRMLYTHFQMSRGSQFLNWQRQASVDQARALQADVSLRGLARVGSNPYKMTPNSFQSSQRNHLKDTHIFNHYTVTPTSSTWAANLGSSSPIPSFLVFVLFCPLIV